METEQKPPRQKKRVVRLIVKLVILLAITGLLVLLLSAPRLLESYIKTQAARLGLKLNKGDVRSLGTSEIDLIDVTLGESEQPDLFIPSLSVNYSPLRIVKGSIEAVRIAGMKLKLVYREGRIQVRGLEPLLNSESTDSATVSFNKLNIFFSEIELSWNDRVESIPIEGVVTRREKSRPYQVSLILKPWGDTVKLQGRIDLDSGNGRLNIQAPSLRLSNLLDRLDILPEIFLRGEIDFLADIRLEDWQLRRSEVSMRASEFRILASTLDVAANWKLEFKLNPALEIEEIDFSGSMERFSIGMFNIAGPIGLIIKGPTPADLDFNCTMDSLTVSSLLSGLETAVPCQLKGKLHISQKEDRPELKGEFSLRLTGIRLPAGKYKNKLDISSRATIRYDFDEKFQAGGTVKIESAALNGPGISMKEIAIALPWDWPDKPKSSGQGPGQLTADTVRIDELVLHHLSARIFQKGDSLTFSGSAATPLEQLKIKFSGVATLPGQENNGTIFEVNYEVPTSRLLDNTPLAKLHPALAGLEASGDLALSGRISVVDGRIESPAQVTARDLSVHLPASQLNIEGINGEFRFSDLILLVSEPAQQLDFRELKIGGIGITEGQLKVAFEKSGAIFLERGSFKWLEGKVLINPVRFRPEKPDVDLSLYCDRIDFDKLINLIVGKPIASGDAEINGIVPLRFEDGYPAFQEGYLYSTPGIEGILAVQESHLISGGVALVEEALKDFRYDWVKVKLVPRGEMLNMVVLIKGIPGQKLALSYDGKKKDFVRDQTGARNVNLKGLVLELRLVDIDLKSLLKSGNKILFK